MKVEVTAEDIAMGQRYSAEKCPVALAIERATGRRAIAGLTTIHWYPPGESWMCRQGLPREVARFIRAFDHGRPVSPFSFSLLD